MMKTTPEEIIAQIPAWQNVQSLTFAEQPGGKTNRNFLVTADGERFVLRLSGENTEFLGIHRATERAATLAAASIGIAPEVIAFLLPKGHMVTRFIEGVEWSSDDIKRPEIVPRVADALRRVHTLPPIEGVFQPYRDIENRGQIAEARGIPEPKGLPQFLQKAAAIEAERTAALGGKLSLCHNDPWHNNYLDDGTVRLLDWEFAGMGDPYFDLSSVAAVYSDEQKAAFLTAYFGEATPEALQMLEQMIFVVVLWNATWALIQIGTEDMSHDYAEMAQGMFDFLAARM